MSLILGKASIIESSPHRLSKKGVMMSCAVSAQPSQLFLFSFLCSTLWVEFNVKLDSGYHGVVKCLSILSQLMLRGGSQDLLSVAIRKA